MVCARLPRGMVSRRKCALDQGGADLFPLRVLYLWAATSLQPVLRSDSRLFVLDVPCFSDCVIELTAEEKEGQCQFLRRHFVGEDKDILERCLCAHKCTSVEDQMVDGETAARL